MKYDLTSNLIFFRPVLVRYWFSKDCLTQLNPFCAYIISSNQITRAHSDNIIINNGHCSQRITSVGWCKCHDKFRIATSLYPYFIIKKICFHNMFPQLLVHPSTECTYTDTVHYDPFFLTEHAIKHNHKPTARPPSTVISATDNHCLPTFASLALVPSPSPSEKQWDRYLSFLDERVLSS